MVQRPSLAGQQFGRYKLLRLLGAGGFAEVYLGEHIDLGTQAAIKVLHTQLEPTDIDAFRTEARTIARLVHPHIIRVLDFNAVDSTPFLVMDYAVGGTMRERYPKGTIVSLSTIVFYLRQVAEALQYAHDEKLIHRDIKPENILLDGHGNALLGDFGIAVVTPSSRYQSTQVVIGTAAYMSPEQIRGKPRPASDQYSLGIVVYEWLSGTCPFDGSLSELWSQHMFAPPPPLHEKVPTISREVEQVVMTTLAKDLKQRFGNVRAFATALQQASQAGLEPTILPPHQQIGKTTPEAKRVHVAEETRRGSKTRQDFVTSTLNTTPFVIQSQVFILLISLGSVADLIFHPLPFLSWTVGTMSLPWAVRVIMLPWAIGIPVLLTPLVYY
jgi:eukaryotic-like serine/threonine-protein kinase